jgi:hypothetical protein
LLFCLIVPFCVFLVEVFWELKRNKTYRNDAAKRNKMTQNDATKRNKMTQSDVTERNVTRENIKTKELMKIKMKWIENGERRQSLQKTGLCVIPVFTVLFTFLYLIVAIVCYM